MTDHDGPGGEPGESTQPLSLGPRGADPTPPAPPPGPGPAPARAPVQGQAWDDYASTTRPLARTEPRHGGGQSRLSGWVWPAVAALALVVGLLGGVGGSAVYLAVRDDTSGPGSVAGGLGAVDTVSLPPLNNKEGSIAAVAKELLPSTVQISAEFDGQPGGATGSGFVLDKQGHIITNNHVVASAAEDDGPIEIVDENGDRYDATLVGRSPVYDLAVLYAPDAVDLKPAALGRSDQLHVGDGVVAIGSPLGLSSTVTAGIVSALKRPVTTGAVGDDSSYINAVQTDAAINPGNSGGPLVNLRGQVVGVNSAIATNGGGTVDGNAGNIGVGFAIPVEQVMITADQILRSGEASYPVIGAQVQTGGVAPGEGAKIDKVLGGTPAEDAGLETGDLVVAVDGDRVTDGIALIVSIRSHQPGEQVKFTYVRNGEKRTTTIELGAETG